MLLNNRFSWRCNSLVFLCQLPSTTWADAFHVFTAAYTHVLKYIKCALIQDNDIKNAIEDAGFEAEILTETTTLKTKPNGTLLGQFTIGGMACAACVNSVEGILRNLPGVKRAVVALATSLGEVEYDPTVISKDDIVNAIEDAGFEASLVQSSQQDKIILGVTGIFSELDVQLLEGILFELRGVRQFRYNRMSSELEVLFDPEVVSSRTLVDGIEGGGSGKLKLHVLNPYARMTSKDVEETSSMFRLFASSLFLSVSILLSIQVYYIASYLCTHTYLCIYVFI